MSEGRGARWAWAAVALVLVAAAAALIGWVLVGEAPVPAGTAGAGDPRQLLWNSRGLDLVVQAAVVFAAALGVLVLFRTEGSR
ncbi:MAG: hypothetical protein K6T75_05620 [Acetobacteraceae bacterium]|nr:hypothetical protein [Acetobacteraceae bacterium]